MNTSETPSPPAEPSKDTKPSADQIDLIRRILAPHIHQARAERVEQPSAA